MKFLMPKLFGRKPVQLVGAVTYPAGGSPTVTWPAGTAVGDFVIISCAAFSLSYDNTYMNASGWYKISMEERTAAGASTNKPSFFMKRLVSGDISSPPTLSGSTSYFAWSIIVYRNVLGIIPRTRADAADSNVTTPTVPGYTKSTDHMGALAFMHVARNTLNTTTPFIEPPLSWTERSDVINTGISPQVDLQFCDLLHGIYDGGSVTWQNTKPASGANAGKCGVVWEMLSYLVRPGTISGTPVDTITGCTYSGDGTQWVNNHATLAPIFDNSDSSTVNPNGDGGFYPSYGYFQVALPSALTIGRFSLNFSSAPPERVYLYGSNDGTTWWPIFETNNSGGVVESMTASTNVNFDIPRFMWRPFSYYRWRVGNASPTVGGTIRSARLFVGTP